VFAAQFFTKTLAFYRVSTIDGTLVASRIIDDTNIDNAYSVALVDLNGDGQKQILTNNHEKNDNLNGVFVYPLPADMMTGEWTKFTIADHFVNAWSLFIPNMSPGFPYAVYPNGNTNERAHILIAGDGDHKAHILAPVGDENSFDYKDYMIVDANGTVGALAYADLDGDGFLEMYMPNYDKGYIEVFKMSAAGSNGEQQFLAQ